MRYLFSILLLGVLAVVSPAFAQDPAPLTEEAVTEEPKADEAPSADAPEAEAPADEAAEAPKADAVPVDEAPAEGAEVKPAEGDEDAAEGGEKADADAKVPATDEEAVETATALLDAIQGKEWPLAVGLLLTLLVYGANKFALKGMVSEKVVPFVAGGVGFAGATGVGLATGESIVDALVAGGLAAVAAVGGWEALSKLLVKKAPEATPETPAETVEKTDPVK